MPHIIIKFRTKPHERSSIRNYSVYFRARGKILLTPFGLSVAKKMSTNKNRCQSLEIKYMMSLNGWTANCRACVRHVIGSENPNFFGNNLKPSRTQHFCKIFTIVVPNATTPQNEYFLFKSRSTMETSPEIATPNLCRNRRQTIKYQNLATQHGKILLSSCSPCRIICFLTPDVTAMPPTKLKSRWIHWKVFLYLRGSMNHRRNGATHHVRGSWTVAHDQPHQIRTQVHRE